MMPCDPVALAPNSQKNQLFSAGVDIETASEGPTSLHVVRKRRCLRFKVTAVQISQN